MPKSRTKVCDAEAMDREIRATCKILESVAKSYPRGSAERGAIREAADAFIYLRLHEGLKQSYEAFQRSCTKPLTKAQQQVLKRAGVTL
ncbi:MAG: hypothetical protein U1F83_01205 [Verrucomicrobiota bacterium]